MIYLQFGTFVAFAMQALFYIFTSTVPTGFPLAVMALTASACIVVTIVNMTSDES